MSIFKGLVVHKILLLFLFLPCFANSKAWVDLKAHEIFTDNKVLQLAEASAEGNTKEIKELISLGVSPNSEGKHKLTPLFYALSNENISGFIALLENGANPNHFWEGGGSVMHSLNYLDKGFLEAALKFGGNPNLISSKGGITPIFNAVSPNNKQNLDALLAAGANINAQNSMKLTPMAFAVTYGQYDVVLKLLSQGADPFIVNNWGNDLSWGVNEDCKMHAPKERSEDFSEVIKVLRSMGMDLAQC